MTCTLFTPAMATPFARPYATFRFLRWTCDTSVKLINARYETLKDKLSFKNTKRCGIFANGWFEWKNIGGKKKPFYHFTNEEYFFLGGVYNQHGCVIVTKEAEGALRNVHNRMPLFFSEKDLDLWLQEKDTCLFNNNPSSKIKVKEINSIQQINSFLKSILTVEETSNHSRKKNICVSFSIHLILV